MTDSTFKWITAGGTVILIVTMALPLLWEVKRTPEPKPERSPWPAIINQNQAGADLNAVMAMMRREGFSNFVMRVTKQGFQFEIGLGDEASKVFYVKPLE